MINDMKIDSPHPDTKGLVALWREGLLDFRMEQLGIFTSVVS